MSMYEFSVPAYRQILAAQIALIDKAIAYCAENKIEEAALLQERLAPDMNPLQFQWQQTVLHSAGAIAKFTGAAAPAHDGATLAALKSQLSAAMAFLDAVKPGDLAGKEVGEVSFVTPRRTMLFTGRDYITSFAMPNFMFHATTAYDILRKLGVAIGKRDFLGAVRMTVA